MSRGITAVPVNTFNPIHCIHQVFIDQAIKKPDFPALVYNGRMMTYRELNGLSNQLAQHLQSLGIQKEDFVAICMDRSFEMFIAIMGILKAGGAYVPIDTDYPADRLTFMLEDAKAKVVLTQEKLLDSLPEVDAAIVCLDSDWWEISRKYNPENTPFSDTKPQNLAYMIYTSGSTGKPKGVMISHENVIHQLEGQQAIAPSPIQKMMLTCSISFDVSVLTIFWTLLQGAPLVIPKQGEERDMQRLSKLIKNEQVTHILTLPSLHTLLLDQASPESLQSLQLVNVSGEVCPLSLAKKHERVIPKAQLYNLYGPTEATVNCTFFTIPKGFNQPKIPIGQPILNYELFILDQDGREVAPGEVGEIYIGGSKEVVGRGYWNRPVLSAERFINNPYRAVRGGSKLYKTGDLGRWIAGGNIEFLGRSDFQVKFRGFRIELGEIEVAIGNHLGVREVVVTLKEGVDISEQRLIAYVVPSNRFELTVSELRDYLDTCLPEYMIPTTFVFLEKMPLTTNGKIDRKALPEPSKERPHLAQAYEAPETKLELYLTSIWEDLLKIEPIGKKDKFFELGGTSILAAQFIGRIQKEMNTSVFITTIFDNPTIEEYAEMLEMQYKAKVQALFEQKQNPEKPNQQHHLETSKKPFNNLSVQKLSSRDMALIGQGESTKSKSFNPSQLQNTKLDPSKIIDFQSIIPKLSPKSKIELNPAKNPPAVFILAPPRSGTTLLRVMLAGHPQLFAANELQLLGFQFLTERSEAYQGKFALWSEGLIRALMELKSCSADEAVEILNSFEKEGMSTKQMYSVLQEWIGDRILVDKSPSYALDKDVLRKAEMDFDNAIFIHLIRHPYSMVNSFEKYHMDQVLYLKNHDYSARELGELVWLESHRNISEFLEKVPRHRHIRVMYEELVSHPSKVIWEVLQKIGVPFHDNVLRPYHDLDKKMVDGIYKHSRSMGDINFDKQSKINADKAEEWKGVFEDDFLSEATWSMIDFFGYNKEGGNDPSTKIDQNPTFDYGGNPFDLAKEKTENTSDNVEIDKLVAEVLKENQADDSEEPIQQEADGPKLKKAGKLELPSSIQTHKNPKVPSKEKKTGANDIAIIGMACRVPGANNLEEFWHNLIEGKDVGKIVELTRDMDSNQVGRSYVLEDAGKFDASFFGYHPKEAQMMDPQHRVFLEVAYSALENAGYNSKTYNGKIGIFGGVARNSYFTNNIATHQDLLSSAAEYQDMLGSEKAFSVTRVAYKLNLKGPAVNVQTACSSSGVAVHLACQSILEGDSDMVLVGGGRIQPPLDQGYKYTEGGPLSPEGYCKAFDEKANGMVQGHGMVMILLKKVENAIEDRDHIWAVIKGTAINNDGSEKIGFTAPSIKGQSEAIQKAHAKAGVSADSINYIEAHGTGTILGDPIEIQGLTDAFRKTTDRNQFCAIGSVKTNIGHLDAGACVAGIIKTALSLKHEMLPPSLHFNSPNPQINFKESPFRVLSELISWRRNDNPRRAGVSSFGLGGTNAHVVLEEAPKLKEVPNSKVWPSELLALSGKTETALQHHIALFAKTKKSHLSNIAYSAALGKEAFLHRKALIINDLKSKDTRSPKKTELIKVEGSSIKKDHPIVFLFPGGGAQYLDMGRDLYQNIPLFKDKLDECLQILKMNHGIDVGGFIYGFSDSKLSKPAIQKQLEKPSIALPVLFSIEYALATTWMTWGIQPVEMIGHSMGEYTAACLSGVISLKDALALVTVRGKLFEKLPAEGGMLSVPISEKEIHKFMDNGLCVAVVNKPDNCVVSGSLKSVDRLQVKLQEAGIEAKKIHIAVAAHSPQVDPILESFHHFLENIKFKKPQIPYISNVTGTWVTEEQVTSTEYWLKHLRQTVRFSDGLETLFKNPKRIFLEVGPGQTLSTFARQHPAKNPKQLILASIRHPKEAQNDLTFIQKTIAKLWVEGKAINWDKFYEGLGRNRAPLPTYPFERKRFWIEPKIQTVDATVPTSQPIQASEKKSIGDISVKPEKVETASEVAKEKQNTIQANTMNNTIASRKSILIQKIKNILYELSGLEPEDMEVQASFLEMGFDSLFLSQAVIHFNKNLGLKLSFRQLFEEAASIEALADYADEILPADKFSPKQQASSSQESNSNQLNQISEKFNESTSDFEENIRRQLSMIEQQLNLLKNGGQGLSQKKDEASKPVTIPIARKKSAIEKETKTIKRKVKGVTEKMGNYRNISTSDDLSSKQRKGLNDFMKRYISMTSKSKKQAQEHRKYYADPRSVTGFGKLWKEIVYQISAERSKGSKIWDIDGNEYLDFVMSYGVALFGHAPDFVQKAVMDQVFKGNSLDVLPPQSTEVAKMICKFSGMDRATLANTGTEAVLGAVRAARTYSGKDKIAVFDTDYHGLIGQFMLRGVHLKDRTNVLPAAAGIPNFVVENTLVLDYDDEAVLQKLEAEIQNLAAVVIEPIQAQNPHWQHFDLIKKIRTLTQKHDVALIFDEIINGFRLHQQGAQAWYGVEADIVAYGKSISGGLPLSAIAGKEKYMKAFDGGWWQFGDDSTPDGTMTYFASTFIKNATSVTAAHAALKELSKKGANLQMDLNRKTFEFANKVKDIFLKTKAPLFIQNTSSFFMIKPADSNPLTRLFHYFLRLQGVNMRERPCFVSTAHTEADFKKAYKGIKTAIKEMYAADLMQPYSGEDLNIIVAPPKHLLKERKWKLAPQKLPLTEGQKEIFVSSMFNKDSSAAYNIGTEIRMEGKIDLKAFRAAIYDLTQRHDALRLSFSKDGQYQTLLPELDINIPLIDLSKFKPSEQESQLNQLHLEQANEAFDLRSAPLFRCKIVKLGKETHLLLFTIHHIISDGWSLGIMTHDLGKLYASRTGIQIDFPESKPFSDFIKEQEAFKKTAAFKETNQYWLSKFEGELKPLALQTDYPRPKFQTYRADCQRIKFSLEGYQNIQKVAAQNGSTFYFFLFSAFQTYLSKIAKQDDLTIGIVAAGQNLPGNNQLVGHVANLLPIRMQIDSEKTFKDHLKAVRGALLDAFEHQNFTFGELVRQLTIKRDTSRNPLVTLVFNMDSPLENLHYGKLNASTRPIQKQFETFDLFINVKPLDDCLLFEWFYNVDLYKKETILNRLQEFKSYLNEILNYSNEKIANLTIASEEEVEDFGKPQPEILDLNISGEEHNQLTDVSLEIIKQSSSSGLFETKEIKGKAVEKENLLHFQFEQQVKKSPKQVALEFEGTPWTYQKLNYRANAIANALIERGVKPGIYVALFLNRTPDLIAGILGILKTGAAYLPLDSQNPAERLKVIIEDAGAEFILTEQSLKERLPQGHFKTVMVEAIREENATNPNVVIPFENHAYIIYTSGSTGIPKGLAIRHNQITQHLKTVTKYLNFSKKDVVFSVISASFDPSVQDFFMPLFCGAKLILANQNDIKDPYLLKENLNASAANWMVATPATWRMLLLAGWGGKKDLNIISTGEALSKKLGKDLFECGKSLWNFYGPTETVIYATAKQIFKNDLEEGNPDHWVSIGKALPETKVYILDDKMQSLPSGSAGELYIAGFRVANGYHNRSEKTAEVFLQNPFKKEEVIYKTGDLVIREGDGNIRFINRMDNQVKLRGHRIELGEIEAKIRNYEAVNEAVVLLREDEPGNKKLVAYVKSGGSMVLDIDSLSEYLTKSLPNYMLPSAILELSSFPLTASGKINRGQLPAPEIKSQGGNLKDPKASKTELGLLKIWQELLNNSEISLVDNFYEIGGHSLLAVGMMAQIEEKFKVSLPLVTFIENATIKGIASIIDSKLGISNVATHLIDKHEPIAKSESLKSIPLTEGQAEIWVSHHLHDEAAKSFNIGSEIILKGELNVPALEEAVNELIQRHEALRTSINSDGKTQSIQPSLKIDLPHYDWSHFEQEDVENRLESLKKLEIEQVFDLQKAPLAHFILLKIKENEHLLLLTMHHILLDGWSLGVLTEDLGKLYQHLSGQKQVSFKPASQLSDYVEFLEKQSDSEDFQQSEKFWLDQFSNGIPTLKLPTEQVSSTDLSFKSDQFSLEFPVDFIERLKETARQHHTTFYTYMFAAFQAYLSKLAQQDSFVLGVSVSGKNIVRFNDLVAHRTNLLPLKIEVDQLVSFKEYLGRANKQLLEAFDHQDYTLGTLVKKLKVSREGSRHPLLSVVFNMETMNRSYDFGDLEVETEFVPGNYKTLDLIVHMKPSRNGYEFKWIYKKDLFSQEEVERKLNGFNNFLRKVLLEPERPLSEISIMTEHQLESILKLGRSETSIDFELCALHELLESQVLKSPHKKAVIFGNQSLTFLELNKKANQLARYLIDKGVRPEEGANSNEFIGVCLERSPNILVSIYAILKAGAAYVPLDPLNPNQRLKAILEDANCKFLITEKHLVRKTVDYSGTHIIWEEEEKYFEKRATDNLNKFISPMSFAYAIYTSGSTGQPKGVTVQHKSVLNTLYGINSELKISQEDTFYSVSSMAFDMSVPDYFLSLGHGATLILANSETKKDGFLLREDLELYQPTMMQATPTTWKILLLAGWQGNSSLKALAGGESFSRELAKDLLEKCYKVWNGYGPTETTIYATFQEVNWNTLSEYAHQNFIPIGKPNPNVEVLILDKDRKLVPLGIEGELYISGPGVARGYLNNNELTGQYFLSGKKLNPDAGTGIWYKTGDLVKMLPNGDIDFLGRIDNQVKIRGFRIELGEIETALNNYEKISQSAVTVHKSASGRDLLVAYIEMDRDQELEESEIKSFLRNHIPGYMVPSVFVKMDAIPLTNSLKIDRKALPKPNLEGVKTTSEYVLPKTDIEYRLVEIWKKILGLRKVSTNEDFFELGGHSLVAVELMSIVHKEFGKKLPLTILFQNASIQKLAALIDGNPENTKPKWTSLVPVKPKGKKPPIYLVHGGGLHVLFYQTLVKYLHPEQPVYALQAKGLDGKSEPLESIEEMAAHYIQEILSDNPTEPISLAGYSLGGLIAFEMTRQLKEMGKEVKVLAMLDAVARYNWEGRGVSGKLKKKFKKAGFNLNLLLKEPTKTAKYKAEVLKMQRLHLKGKVDNPHGATNLDPSQNEGNLAGKKVYEKSMQAFEKYELKPLDIKIDLFKAKDQMFYLNDPEYYGWNKFAKEGVAIHEIEGNHMTLFEEKNGKEVARILQQCLDGDI